MLSNNTKRSYKSTIMKEGGDKDAAKEEDKKDEEKKEEPKKDPKERPDPDPEKDYVDFLGCCTC